MFLMPILTTQKWVRVATALAAGVLFLAVSMSGQANPAFWQLEWPQTDFSKSSVPLENIFSGGVPKDGIPPIYNPRFASIEEVDSLYVGTEPMITISINGEARAYALGVLMTHEIVNDVLGGMPIAVTWCPLCNSAFVFDRTIDGKVHEFGVSGKLYNSNLVMWDRQTESWWLQFTGQAIVGELTGVELDFLPSRTESFDRFKERFPDGEVLLSPRGGPGFNPYAGYDSASQPFLFRGDFPEGIAPLAYIVAVDDEAWSLERLQKEKRIETEELVITWEPGQNAAMDARNISQGRDIGNVVVQRRENGSLVDAVYDVTFAFAFNAFFPDGTINK
tara:strand:+ start:20576 stop:21577 length:1002 start_codon:yes stop_codon:yes gene_type:complete